MLRPPPGDDTTKKMQWAIDPKSPSAWRYPLVSILSTALSCFFLESETEASAAKSTAVTSLVLVGMALVGMSTRSTESFAQERVRVGSMLYVCVWTLWTSYESFWPANLRMTFAWEAWTSALACASGMAYAYMSEDADTFTRPGLPDVAAALCLFCLITPVERTDLDFPFMHIRLGALSIMWFSNLFFQCALRAKEFTWFYLVVVCSWTLAVSAQLVWIYAGVLIWMIHLASRTGTTTTTAGGGGTQKSALPRSAPPIPAQRPKRAPLTQPVAPSKSTAAAAAAPAPLP